MTRRRTTFGLPVIATDFLFLLVLAFLLLINPPTLDAEVKAPGNISVVISWEPGPIDVDLWSRGPGEKSVGYSRRSGRVHNLLRDDLGTAGDDTALNFETAFSRGLPAGEYAYSAHCYTCSRTVRVAYEIRLAREAGARPVLLFSDAIDINPKEERVLVRFRLDINGNVVPGSATSVGESLRAS